jgi:hypothetical protein
LLTITQFLRKAGYVHVADAMAARAASGPEVQSVSRDDK